MKRYESVIIVNSSLNEETLNRIITRCEDVIKKHGGTIINTNLWGKRRLAYPIKKFQYGFYIIFDFEAPSELVSELELEYRLNEHILRYITLFKDKKAILTEQRRKAEEERLQTASQTAEHTEVINAVQEEIVQTSHRDVSTAEAPSKENESSVDDSAEKTE